MSKGTKNERIDQAARQKAIARENGDELGELIALSEIAELAGFGMARQNEQRLLSLRAAAPLRSRGKANGAGLCDLPMFAPTLL